MVAYPDDNYILDAEGLTRMCAGELAWLSFDDSSLQQNEMGWGVKLETAVLERLDIGHENRIRQAAFDALKRKHSKMMILLS